MAAISVIIPTYNRAGFVGRAIDSVLSQSRVPDEIVVVDDGSTDNTPEVLAAYGAPVMVIADGINRGRSSARNRGLDIATGDFIAFLDSDDTLPRNSIERRLNALETHPDMDVVYSDAYFLDAEGRVINRFSAVRRHPRPSGRVFYQMMFGNLAPIHAYMFRRTAITAPIRMDETLNVLEDYDFWLNFSRNSRFLYIDEPLANYYVHDSMTTTNETQAMRRSRIIVQERGIDSTCFGELSPPEQARILTQYGASYAAVVGDMSQARRLLRRAIARKPIAPQAWLYWMITWSGNRGVHFLNNIRRWINRHVTRSAFPTGGEA